MARNPGKLPSFVFSFVLGFTLISCSQEEVPPPPPSPKVTVVMHGDVFVKPPCPVLIAGVEIGTVADKTLDAEGRPVLELNIDPKYLAQLKQSTIFYLNTESAGAHLIGETLDNTSPQTSGELVFLGFNTYSRFMAWKAVATVKKGWGNLREFIDETLKGLKKKPQNSVSSDTLKVNWQKTE